LLLKVNGCCCYKIDGCYGKQTVASVSQWLWWNTMVAMESNIYGGHLLLWKATVFMEVNGCGR
jgi:hypothetical protein